MNWVHFANNLSICKAIEDKLKDYKIVKKGYIENAYTVVYKNNTNQIVINGNSNSNVLIYIVKKDYDLSGYINGIKEKSDDKETMEIPEVVEAPAVDSTVVEVPAVEEESDYYN